MKNGNTKGLLSLIFGILSIVSVLIIYLAVPFGIAAIVLGLKSRQYMGALRGKGRIGLVTGLIGMILSIIILIASMAFVFSTFGSIENFYNSYGFYAEEMMGVDLDGDGIVGYPEETSEDADDEAIIQEETTPEVDENAIEDTDEEAAPSETEEAPVKDDEKSPSENKNQTPVEDPSGFDPGEGKLM